MSDGNQMSVHKARSLRRTAAGGFELQAPGAERLRLQPVPGGWQVEADGELGGWRLDRGSPHAHRFILYEADGSSEAGRTLSLPDSGREPDLRYLLTSDGCLYRMRLRGPQDGRYELQSWEAPGAYLTARPGSSAWTISPDPASSGLREIRPLMILFAAEILDSEEPLTAG